MSHSLGIARFEDGTLRFFEYSGTADIACAALWETVEELHKHWRDGTWNYCVCRGAEPVTLWTDYGGGFYWSGTACRRCRAIIEGQAPFEGPTTDGAPDWAKPWSDE